MTGIPYIIYQCPPSCPYCLCSYPGDTFTLKDYVPVSRGTSRPMEPDELLDLLWSKYQDWGLRSMSVSDVVVLKIGEETRYYYVEPIGFALINSIETQRKSNVNS